MSAGQQFTERYLKVMFFTLKDATPEEVRAELEHCRRNNRKPVRVPKLHRDHFCESRFEASNGFSMQLFSTFDYGKDTVIVYLHGGACIYQPVFFHWRFVHDLALRTHCQVIMPIYPTLSPVPSAYKAASGWGVAASTQRRGVDCGDGKMPSTQDADFRAGHQNPTGSLLFSALMCPQPLEQ